MSRHVDGITTIVNHTFFEMMADYITGGAQVAALSVLRSSLVWMGLRLRRHVVSDDMLISL